MKGMGAMMNGPRSWETMDDDAKKELKSQLEEMGMVKEIIESADVNNDGKVSFDEACKAFFKSMLAESGGMPADPEEAKQAVIKKFGEMTMKEFWEFVDRVRQMGQASTGKLLF